MTTQTRIRMVTEPTASPVLVWPAFGTAGARGISTDALAEAAELELDVVAAGTTRVPLRGVQTVWARLALQLDEPLLGVTVLSGIDAGSAMSWPEPVSLYEHLFRACDTLGDGIDALGRYARLLRDSFEVVRHSGDGVFGLRMNFSADDPPTLVQLHLTMAMHFRRRVLPDVPCVDEVWFRQPAPPDPRIATEFFGLPVRFGAPFDGLVSERAWWDAPLPTASPGRFARLEHRADALIALLPNLDRVRDRVIHAIRGALPDGDLRAQSIAKQLAMSPRTMQRRLQAEGESYQNVLDSARCDLAKQQLDQGELSVREVAERVGFTNVSAFHRAFKSWTGVTPAEYRERGSAGLSS